MNDPERFVRFESPSVRGKKITVLDDGAYIVSVTASAEDLDFVMAQAERTGEDPLYVIGRLAYKAFRRHYRSSMRRLKRMSTSSSAERCIR